MSDSFTGQQINASVIRLTAAQWAAQPYVLPPGVIGEETDTGKAKIGDGSTAWSSLAYTTSFLSASSGLPSEILTNAELVRVQGALSNGYTDIYTVPDGKRAMLYTGLRINPTGGAVSGAVYVKTVGGTYYRIQTAASAAANGCGVIGVIAYIFEPGEQVAVLHSGNSGRYDSHILLLPDTSPLRSYKFIPAVANTPQLVYSVPESVKAYILPTFAPYFSMLGGASYALAFFNTVGSGVAVVTLYGVPDGGSADITTQVTVTSVADGGQNMGLQSVPILEAGESMWAKSSKATAGEFGYIVVFEEPV